MVRKAYTTQINPIIYVIKNNAKQYIAHPY